MLLVLLSQFVLAQPAAHPTLDPGLQPTQYVHDVWTSTSRPSPLPQNYLYAITQTPDGYLWMGTQEGLVRFDGKTFHVFNKQNTPVLGESSWVRALHVAPSGTLWIGTTGGTIVRYTDGVFDSPAATASLTRSEISTLLEDEKGQLWVGTFGDGLFLLHDTTRIHLTEADGLADSYVSSLYEDTQGRLWIGTHSGMNRIRTGQAIEPATPYDLTDTFVHALYGGRGDTLWVGAHDGLHYLTIGTSPPLSGRVALPYADVLSLHQDTQGSLWAGTDGGGLFRVRGNRVDGFTTAEGLTHDKVRALYQDHEGSLWIGTESGGLNRLRGAKFVPYGPPEGMSSSAATSIFQSADGSMWLGTEGGGLNRLQNGRITSYSTANGLSHNVILSLGETRPGTIWIGTPNGLNRFENGSFRRFSTANGLPNDVVYALTTGYDGTLWIGTNAGVAAYREGDFSTITDTTVAPIAFVTTLHEDVQHRLWIGTYGNGLYRFDGNRLIQYTTENGLRNDIVLDVQSDRSGNVWVSTHESGLSLVTDDGITAFTTADGLYSDNVYQILEDADGDLWLGSSQGIVRLSREALLQRQRGTNEPLSYQVYTTADGLRSADIKVGFDPAGWRSRDGRLWFPTPEGVAVIDPQNHPRLAVPPQVVVESAVAGHQGFGHEAALSPGIGRITFHFTALTFIAPDSVRFRYRLAGLEDEWQETDGTMRLASYTNLPPGSYTFEVQARNHDGIWSATPATFSFRQKPFFHQTPWFFLLVALVLLGLGVAGYKLRVAQYKARQRELETVVDERTRDLREQKEQTEKAKAVIEEQAEKLQELDRFKTRFFANISHEFRTPLTLMVGPLENALYGAYGTVGGPLRAQIEVMHRNALRLLRLINQLLDLSKLEAGKMELHARPRNLAQFIEGIVYSFTAFAEQKHIALTFQAEHDDVEVYFEPDKLEKVFFNLLSNAVKFTPEWGSIAIAMDDDDTHVRVRVRDSGPGIPREAQPYVFDRFRQVDDSNTRAHEGTGIGLALVKELVLLHKGTVELESTVGEGTTFIITLPKGSAHLAPEEIAPSDEEALRHPEHGAMAEMASGAFNLLERADRDPDEAPLIPTAPADAPLVLMVDDNADILDYVASCLAGRYRTAMARDGAEGYAEARRLRPDLILCDVMMPNVDGYEMTRRVKSDPDLRHIPVILLTAKTSQEAITEGIEMGADEFVAKPFNARELLARIRNLLTLREQERQLKDLNDHLEDKVQDQLKTIIREKARAKEAARLKTEILNNMSHEFRTPLTAILGYADILPMADDHEREEFIRHIKQSGHRLLNTLTSVLDLSTLQASEVQMNPVLIDTRLVVRRLSQQYAEQAGAKGLAFRLDLPDESVVAYLDPRLLARLVEILLENALKFTHTGEVGLRLRATDTSIQLRVFDTGIGISEEFLPHVFEAFKQESEGLARAHEGSGLGLTIAQHLARLLNGKITVSSMKGRGSAFTVQLPRELEEQPPVPAVRSEAAAG